MRRQARGSYSRSDRPGTDVRVSPAPDDDMTAALRFLRALWRLNHALESASRRMKRTYGITGPERLFIRVVGQRPGITPSEVARILSVDRSTVTPLLKRLEARRIVRRIPNPADGRSFHIALMQAGALADELRVGTIESSVRGAIADTDPKDVATCAALLVKISERLQNMRLRPTDRGHGSALALTRASAKRQPQASGRRRRLASAR